MQPSRWIWQNGRLLPWAEATTHVLTHSLHYGSAIFEGIRCYETPAGPAVFRLQDHLQRFLFSAQAIHMPLEYSQDELQKAILKLVSVNGLKQGYIRPLGYFDYGMSVTPKNIAASCAIACWSAGDSSIVPQGVLKVKTSSIARIHPASSISEAKFAGHYLNSNLAALCLQGTEFDEAVMLDTDGFVAEGCGQNIFMLKDGVVYTPQAGHILKGITRATLLELAEFAGFKTVEAKLRLEDFYHADEVFLSGTAAEVAAVGQFDDRVIGSGQIGPITQQLRTLYQQLIHGHLLEAGLERFESYLTYLETRN